MPAAEHRGGLARPPRSARSALPQSQRPALPTLFIIRVVDLLVVGGEIQRRLEGHDGSIGPHADEPL